LHNEELSSNINTIMVITACMGETKNAHKILVGKHEGRRPLGRLRHEFHGP